MHDITTGQSQQVAQHDAPIKVVKWVETPQGSILATGSWDKTLKVRIYSNNNGEVQNIRILTHIQYWDLRGPTPIATVQLAERCYTMDVVYPLLVVGTAERLVQVFDLANPATALKVQ